MCAKSAVGEGKIDFRLNGKDIAGIRAADVNDRKRRVITEGPMAGANCLVRTLDLWAGKNVLEIFQDGERLRRVVYSR
jgi:hypothetical protein